MQCVHAWQRGRQRGNVAVANVACMRRAAHQQLPLVECAQRRELQEKEEGELQLAEQRRLRALARALAAAVLSMQQLQHKVGAIHVIARERGTLQPAVAPRVRESDTAARCSAGRAVCVRASE
eukprot:6182004-Prymnesium_polylepis.1